VQALISQRFCSDILKMGGEVYLVGGCVRDSFLHRPLKDFDIVVRKIPIDSLVALLKKSGQTNLVGKSFGVIKFRPQENPEREIDIALPRTEVSTGSGHKDFQVTSDENLAMAMDLSRRDFTINAMAMNVQNDQLLDPFGGKADLDNKIIRTVFENSFLEDPLRLLRAVQFATRFGFRIEDKTWAQMKEQAQLIRTVAGERIILEVKKLFEAPRPSMGFDLMRDTGILQHVFPDVFNMIGVTQPQKNNEDVYTHTMKVLDAARAAEELEKPGNLDIMFSALFHDAGKPKTRRENEDAHRVTFYNHQLISTGIARRWLRDYRATTVGVDPQHVCHLVKHHMFETTAFGNEKAVRRFITKVGKENIFDLLDLRLADKKGGRFPKKVFGILKLRETIRDEINRKPPFTAKDLALNGFDIINLGYRVGPVIGKIQKFLMEKVLDDPSLNTQEKLTQMVRDEFEKP
jgi:putative nucleotidyltransferase with HDIG domain